MRGSRHGVELAAHASFRAPGVPASAPEPGSSPQPLGFFTV